MHASLRTREVNTKLDNSLVKKESNVIIRNLGIKKVLAGNGDAIGVRKLKSEVYFCIISLLNAKLTQIFA